MNSRQRLLHVLDFQPVDHGFSFEPGLWEQTLVRWRGEGLPADVTVGNLLSGCEFLGLERTAYLPLSVVEMYPPYPEVVLEEDVRYRLVQWADGHISRLLKEGETGGWRMSMDQYVSFPVHDRETFHAIQRRYDPSSPKRYPEWWADHARCLAGRDYPVAVTGQGVFGLYSWLRRLMGTEAACTLFYDDPSLAHEMLDWMTEYLLLLIARAVTDVACDYFPFFEDFAYNAGPLIGPNIFREFLLPRYRRICDYLGAHGVRHIWLDSDGNTEVLIPLFIEAGITYHWPLERAAGMDPLALRKKYGHALALGGGIDKHALLLGRRAIEEELYRHVPQLLEDGGYIPSIDHWIPPDVSYDNFMYYLEVKSKILGQ